MWSWRSDGITLTPIDGVVFASGGQRIEVAVNVTPVVPPAAA